MPDLIYNCPEGKREVSLVMPKTMVGRDPSCQISLPEDHQVSRFHCVVEKRASEVYHVVDYESTNGTFLNGEKIGDRSRRLHHGDRIRVGKTVLVYSDLEKHVEEEARHDFDEISREMAGGKGYSTIFHEIVKDRQGE